MSLGTSVTFQVHASNKQYERSCSNTVVCHTSGCHDLFCRLTTFYFFIIIKPVKTL